MFASADKGVFVLRITVTAVLLVVATGASVALLAIIGLLPAPRPGGPWAVAGELLSPLDGLPLDSQLAAGAGAFLAGLLALLGVIRLFERPHAESVWHLLDGNDRGVVVMDSLGVATIATQAALRTDGVVDAQTTVRGRGLSSVRLRVHVGLYPSAPVKSTGQAVRQAVHEAVENMAGLTVHNVVVKAHVLEPDDLVRVLR